MPKITFVLEDGQEIVVPLTDRVTVGSAEGNDVLVDDERVSAHHAELLLNADGSVQLFDLKSGHGSFVNGMRVASHTLMQGDKIAFGPLQGALDLEIDDRALPASTPPVPPPSGKTARITASAKTRRVKPVKAAATAPPEPQSLPPEALRAAENRLALLETAATQAEAAHRDWLAAIEALSRQHDEKSTAVDALRAQTREHNAELTRLTTAASTEQARLEAVQKKVRAEEERLSALSAEVTAAESRIREAAEQASRHQDEVKTAQEALTSAQAQLASLPTRLAEISTAEEKLASLRAECQEAEKRHADHSSAITRLQTERQQQEQALAAGEERLTAAQEALKTCQEEHAAEKRQLEEARALRASLEAANNAPLDDLHQRIDKARHELGILEARLMPLRDWKEAQERRIAHLSALPADSPDARELQREIDSEAADLLRIIHTPPSRTPHTIQVEPPYLRGVPMKSEHTRVRKSGE